jgi:hypothetical protein
MSKATYCEDCGCKCYNGACVNCHEEIYIEKQYIDLEMDVPKLISEKANEQRKQIVQKS